MRKVPILLLLLAAPLPAGVTREEYVAARDKLKSAYFDELAPDSRDRLFEALAYDAPEMVSTFAQVASVFGTYLSGLQARVAAEQRALEPYASRPALTDIEIGLRNSHLRKLEKLEREWRRARASEEVLARVLGSLRNPKAVQSAMTTLSRHPTAFARRLVALAAARWHKGLADERMSKRLVSMLGKLAADKAIAVRVGVARAAAAFRRKEGLRLLERAVRDPAWEVRGAAVKALKGTGTDEAVGLLIKTMQKESGRLRDDINTALEELTGEKLRYAESWARWWKSVGGHVPPRKPKRDVAGEEQEPKPAKNRDDVHFYGIRTRSDRICFIIDVSGSMKKKVPPIRRVVITGKKTHRQPAEGKTRIEVARNELKRAVYNLSPKKRFLIIYFNQAVRKWRPEMLPATPGNKKQAMADVDKMQARGATYTLGALREAFTVAGVLQRKGVTRKEGAGIDTIFLLSDGGPTDNKVENPQPMDPDLILDQVREWNRDAGIVIHTIAVDTDENGTYFLSQLAAQNGGVFVERK